MVHLNSAPDARVVNAGRTSTVQRRRDLADFLGALGLHLPFLAVLLLDSLLGVGQGGGSVAAFLVVSGAGATVWAGPFRTAI